MFNKKETKVKNETIVKKDVVEETSVVMKKLTMEGMYTLGQGNLVSGLDHNQLKRRIHNLEETEEGSGVYKTIKPGVMFKKGEKVTLNVNEIPKKMRHLAGL